MVLALFWKKILWSFKCHRLDTKTIVIFWMVALQKSLFLRFPSFTSKNTFIDFWKMLRLIQGTISLYFRMDFYIILPKNRQIKTYKTLQMWYLFFVLNSEFLAFLLIWTCLTYNYCAHQILLQYPNILIFWIPIFSHFF